MGGRLAITVGGDVTSYDGDGDRGFVERARRFFWLPRREPRDAAPVLPLARVWLCGGAVAAGTVVIGWFDVVVLAVVGTVFAMLDDVIKGVRHRWPAFVVGLGAGWSVGRLVGAGVPASVDPDWASYSGLVCGSLAAFVAFAAITRLPEVPRSL